METRHLLVFICAVLPLLHGVNGFLPLRKCYDALGCFRTNGDFFDWKNRPVSLLPQSPKWIGTTFTLHRRGLLPQRIKPDQSLAQSAFSPERGTKFIVHGFTGSSDGGWMQEMRQALLNLADLNVIVVDWRRGALPPYSQATANTRVVGAEIAYLINKLVELGANAVDFHIIGHSLGAHISGYAGERTPGLGRISGLDPADPYFQYMPPSVRLDPTDAAFVDVIHTDADHIVLGQLAGSGGFGTKQPSGHVDFYPNGGYNQPGCSKGDLVVKTIHEGVVGFIEGSQAYLGCDHLRVYNLYIESIKSGSCYFTSYPCSSYADFKDGLCRGCAGVGCGRMGYYADTAKPMNGESLVTYFLKTGDENPFCLHHYFLTVLVRGGQLKIEGKMDIRIIGSNASTEMLAVDKKAVTYAQGAEYRFVLTSLHHVSDITGLAVQWKSIGVPLLLEALVVDNVNEDLSEHRYYFPTPTPLLSGGVLHVQRM